MPRLLIALAVAAVVGFAIWFALPRGAPGAGDRAAVDACLAAQHEVAAARATRGGPSPPGQPSDGAVVSRGCAPLFRQPACRDVMLRFDEAPPEARAATVQKVCAAEYCPLLADPKPAVCAHWEQDPTGFAEWGELRAAILKHDLGPELAARAFPAAR
jgi:hypothetical protein